MKRSTAVVAAIALCTTCVVVYAEYSVAHEGLWPKTWPKELEPLRKQSTTLVGPMVDAQHFQIPFTKREEFEAAWPHLLKVKTKGAPVILVRSPYTRLGHIDAGVFIHSPPADTDKKANPEARLSSTSVSERRMWTTYIELIVDGNVVDLNRIPLPADTPIVDRRFEGGEEKAAVAPVRGAQGQGPEVKKP